MKKDTFLTTAVFVLLISLFVYAANDWRLPWVPERAPDIAWCEAHDEPLDACDACNPALARGGTQVISTGEPDPGECPNTFRRIELGPGVAEKVGLKLIELETRIVNERLFANAETRFPPDKFARVAPRVSGVVREVRSMIGREVAKGDVLAILDSPDFARAKGDYLQSLSRLKLRQKTYESEKSLYPRLTTVKEMLEAETLLEEAKLEVSRSRERLATLGLGSDQIVSVKETRDSSPRMELAAPFDGVVVDAKAVPGEMAGPEKPLFSIADTSRMWLLIDVYESDLGRLESGQKVFFKVEGLAGQRFPGRIVALGSEVDDRTRTAKVYADVKNVRGLLRANMFGRAEIFVRPPEEKLLVPKEAVQNDGDCMLVFVTPSRDKFIPRKVEIGAVYEGGYEILGGLAAGEKVATTGSFLLKTEILRGQIGAG